MDDNQIDSSGAVRDGFPGMDVALHYHLTCNHYPPQPEALVEPCRLAIEKASAGEWDDEIDLRTYGARDCPEAIVTVRKLVEDCHLEGFIEREDFPD